MNFIRDETEFEDENEQQTWSRNESSIAQQIPKTLCHPFCCRLPHDSVFVTDDPKSLIGVGFVSIALGILTAFRFTPVLLIVLSKSLQTDSPDLKLLKDNYPIIIGCWTGFILFVLTGDGILLACSSKIEKRKILLIPPWMYLFLYADAFFWLSCTAVFHVMISDNDLPQVTFESFEYPLACFVTIYVEITLFLIIHYLFATYYIIVVLTVIENLITNEI